MEVGHIFDDIETRIYTTLFKYFSKKFIRNKCTEYINA